MDPPNLLINTWLIPWPWWLLIGLAAGYFLLLVWSWLVVAKKADKDLARQSWNDQRNGRR